MLDGLHGACQFGGEIGFISDDDVSTDRPPYRAGLQVAQNELVEQRGGFFMGNDFTSCLPDEWHAATLLGRIETDLGPTPILVRHGRVEDLSRVAPTIADLLNGAEPGGHFPSGLDMGPLESWSFQPREAVPAGSRSARLLAPVDLQCIKAAGVTFAASTLERVIEERARGDLAAAENIRQTLVSRIGSELSAVRPGSDAALRLKSALIAAGLWSQYLEVAIGPDAEIFTKAPILSAVGWGDDVGIRADSNWNNPEPEVVLLCDARGQVHGASLGNDVNLRDFEGRSALLLGKAKDNNASCAIGPFIRLFDERFTLDQLREAVVRMEVHGLDGFRLEGQSSMRFISRDPLELVAQTLSKDHQYPDGFALFLGTMFAPIQDRDTVGQGFTHKVGDQVRIMTPSLGALENRVVHCDAARPWVFGVGALMRNLASRGLLATAPDGAQRK